MWELLTQSSLRVVKRQNIALFLKIFDSKKGLLSKGNELISLTVVNKNTKIKSMQYDAPKSILEELLKPTSIRKKRIEANMQN